MSIKLYSIQVPAEASKQTSRWRDKVKKSLVVAGRERREEGEMCILLCFGVGLTRGVDVCQSAVMRGV